jgi:hypothetical protein
MIGGPIPVICIHFLNSAASPPPLRFFHHPHFPYLLEHSYPGITDTDDRHGLWFSPNFKLKRIWTKFKCRTSSSNQINDKLLVRKQRGRRRIQISDWVQWSDMYSQYRISLSSCPIFPFPFCGGTGSWLCTCKAGTLLEPHCGPFYSGYFGDWGLKKCLPLLDWDPNHPHLSLTSITSMSHWLSANFL